MNIIDFDKEKIICNCDTTYNFSKKSDNLDNDISTDKDNDNTSYLDYFLSLINYKIIVCYKLILISANYLNNRLKLKEKDKEQLKKEKIRIYEKNRLEKRLMAINNKNNNNPPINKCNTETKLINKKEIKRTKKDEEKLAAK